MLAPSNVILDCATKTFIDCATDVGSATHGSAQAYRRTQVAAPNKGLPGWSHRPVDVDSFKSGKIFAAARED